jgi:hypothetical protein
LVLSEPKRLHYSFQPDRVVLGMVRRIFARVIAHHLQSSSPKCSEWEHGWSAGWQ